MQHFSNHIDILIEQFAKLPGIGRKTAQRLAFHVINLTQEEVQELADAVVNAKSNIMYCDVCCNIADKSPICGNPSRDSSIICVVEDPRDVAAMEKIEGIQRKVPCASWDDISYGFHNGYAKDQGAHEEAL